MCCLHGARIRIGSAEANFRCPARNPSQDHQAEHAARRAGNQLFTPRAAKLERILELKGIKLRATMTASELQIVEGAAEVAETAENEAQMSHRETIAEEGDKWPEFSPESQLRDQQIEARVEETVGAFIDSQLPKKPPQALIANPTQPLRLPPTEAQTIAWDIGGLVMGRL